jgi:glycosyltransferase involved in cell wall biosynthesis
MSAFAFNKPVIATNVGGFPEQVIHNQFGLIVAPNNIQALTNAMSELCENHNKLLHLQENIRMSYEQHGINSWEKIVSEMMHIYTAISYSK